MDEIKQRPTIRRAEKGEKIVIEIPQCCKEGWDTCIHVAKKQKPKKRNIGL